MNESEDPIQKEIRLRAEAKERLRKKFGEGGIGRQAVGSSPIPPGGYGNQPASSSQAGDEYEWSLSIITSITKTLSNIGQGLVKSFQDAKIGETIQSGVTSVKNKLNDPEFQKDVKQKAEAGWSWLSSTAGSIWNAAKEAATQISNDFNEAANDKPNSPRPSVSDDTPVKQTASQPAPKKEEDDDDKNSDIEEEENDDDWMEKELAKAK